MVASLISARNDLLLINWIYPVNRMYPLNRGLVAWYLCIPGTTMGGAKWNNILRMGDKDGLHGTLTNMDPATDWVGLQGRPGGWGALDFDGTNDYVGCGTGVNTDGEFTYLCWFSTRYVTSADSDPIISNSDSTGATDGMLEINRTDGRLSLLRSGAAVTVTGNTDLSANRWYHTAATISGSSGNWTGTLYLDGANDGSATDTNDGSSTTPSLIIGRLHPSLAARIFNGLIDDVRIYDRALSAAEIAEYYTLSRRYYPGLLNRVRPVTWFVPEAGAGAARVPYRAQNYLIGGGIV